MIGASEIREPESNVVPFDRRKKRIDSRGDEPAVLADVYREEVNIVVWERQLSAGIKNSVDSLLASNDKFEAAMTVTPQSVLASIGEALGTDSSVELGEDIAGLVDMFCCLLGLKRAGLRLATLNRAMCPRFHVDRVPCRLVTTYQGVATEWLPHQSVDRSKLGPGWNGQSDFGSGLYQQEGDVRQLGLGDVALLKGELWEGNEDAGLVHRSPAVPTGENRLLLTLDVSS